MGFEHSVPHQLIYEKQMSLLEWKDLFNEKFEDFSDPWTLVMLHRSQIAESRKLDKQFNVERQYYARFHCPRCSNSWASARATAILYYPHPRERVHRVTLRLYGQLCKKCNHRGNQFADPEFETETIGKILDQVHERIAQNHYHQRRPERTIRKVKPENRQMKGPHEKSLCEACLSGHCDKV